MGGYAGAFTLYDNMGRVSQQSNVEEADPWWSPAGDDSAGWNYTTQTYDWKGRPRITTNQDGITHKEASYGGCGCAGGEVVTLTDEMNREQKIYSDVLGRQWKTEVLNWPDANGNRSVYSATVSVFNAVDQVTKVRQYAGAAPTDASSTNGGASCPTGTCQESAMTFDGYGRLKTRHAPEQQADPNISGSTDHTT